MDFYDTVSRRRTVRDFADREVPPEVVKRVLEAGMKAPSNDHLRNREFVVIPKNAIQSILKRVADGAAQQTALLKSRKLTESQQQLTLWLLSRTKSA